MEAQEFLRLADAELARIEAALEAAQAAAPWDYEIKAGGIIEIECPDGSKLVLNRHSTAQEIWLAAKAGGYHFKPPNAPGEPWRDSRDGTPLATRLSECLSAQVGVETRLEW